MILGRVKYGRAKGTLLTKFRGERRYVETIYDGVSNESYIDRYFGVADLFPYRGSDKQERLRVLDLGSSFGIAAFGLKELLRIKGYDAYIIGVDPERQNFTFPQEYHGMKLISGLDEKVQGLAQDIPLSDGSVDFVVFQNVNQGSNFREEDGVNALIEIIRVLRPQGSAYILEYGGMRRKFPGEIQGKLVGRDQLIEYAEVMQRKLNSEPLPK